MKLLGLPLFFLLSTAAFAASDRPDENIFGADLSNPDLALAVTSFEDVCMPFILHKTELPHAMNKTHRAKQLQTAGFDFESVEEVSGRYLVRASYQQWKPGMPGIPMKIKPKGKFTVFKGISLQMHETTLGLVVQKGEITLEGGRVPAFYKTYKLELETYSRVHDRRLKAQLGYNSRSQNYPAKSCSIMFETPLIDKAALTQNLIEKDTDWQPYKAGWKQCVSDGDDKFFFTAVHVDNSLLIDVTRNGFYEENPCR